MNHASDTTCNPAPENGVSDIFSLTPGASTHIMSKIRHDANGHLRGVIELTRLLEQQEKAGTDKHEMLRLIRESGENARRLVSGVTAFAEHYSAIPAIESVDGDAVMHAVIAELRMKNAPADYTVDTADIGAVHADSTMFRAMLYAILDNAFHYFSRHAKKRYIDIRAERTHNMLTLDVSDTGLGMNPEYFERAFVITERMQTHDNYQGAGIGLSTARIIARRHGGDVAFIAPHSRFKTTTRVTWPIG